jgi:uncharacterized Ntn-hydrolase superfamily protein
MTFSIAARCAETGQFGIAISSSSPAVAARCAHLRSRVGAVCSQNVTDPRLGPATLEHLDRGFDAQAALDRVVAASKHIAWRQLAVVDRLGRTATWSGERCLGRVATAETENAVAAGNLLGNQDVPQRMVNTFAASAGRALGDRLVAALQAGLDEGGEEGPVRSAGLLVVDDVPWPVTDLRVDWSSEPIRELTSLWRLWRPQAAAYRLRALDPERAPGYGVPGDQRTE